MGLAAWKGVVVGPASEAAGGGGSGASGICNGNLLLCNKLLGLCRCQAELQRLHLALGHNKVASLFAIALRHELRKVLARLGDRLLQYQLPRHTAPGGVLQQRLRSPCPSPCGRELAQPGNGSPEWRNA